MEMYNYQKSGEYSIMVFTDADADHSHFSGRQLAGINAEGERVAMVNTDGTFPKEIFEVKGSYQDCCGWFEKTESLLRRQGHSVHTYTEECVAVPRKRMLVNLPPEDVAYMEANSMIFLTEENASENIAGELLESDEPA